MPAFCTVQSCGDKYGHADNISFHKFPFKRQELMQKWLKFADRGPDWQPSKWSAVCSRHFRDDDFKCSADRKILKKTAVPSVQVLKQGCDHAILRLQSEEDKSKVKDLQQSVAKIADEVPPSAEPIVESNIKHSVNETPSTVSLAEIGEDFEEEQAHVIAPLQSSPIAPKIKCRLCGSACSAVVSFSTNFEIYGMIQKCFPTLNIQKDDHLPKEMCRVCLKRLESFSRFIDNVLETQSELQRKYRTEKANISTRAVERQLKVKQEPVVRVKQEVAEGFESFLSDDLDLGMDEGCEQEHDADTTVEQKYDFCDLPLLNAQDIINNCDIMEIINLDDPFINIPDDDANTSCENGTEPQQQQDSTKQQCERDKAKRTLTSAHELLQAHLLSEEHNYAYAAEDLKEDWQFKNIYKTEKTEGGEFGDLRQFTAHAEPDDDEQAGYAGDEQQQCENDETPNVYKENFHPTNNMPLTTNLHADKLTNNTSSSIEAAAAEVRSTRPIVTSVSDFAKAALSGSNATAQDAICNEKLVTAVNDISAPTANTTAVSNASSTLTAAVKTHSKPNIVVLNESIVKSSSVFQLHTCQCCHLKFFSIESLEHHHNVAHQAQPQLHHSTQEQRPEQPKLQAEHAQQQLQQQQPHQLQDPYGHQQENMLASQSNQYQQHQQQQLSGQLPMVSMPAEYLWKPYGAANDISNETYGLSCKVEKEFGVPTLRADRIHKAEDNLAYQQPPHMFGQPLGFSNSNNAKNTFITPNCNVGGSTALDAPNVVRILEMKRTFLRQHEPYNNSIGNVPPTNSNDSAHPDDFCFTNTPRMECQSKNAMPTLPPTPLLQPATRSRKRHLKINSRVIARLSALERKLTAAVSPDFIAVEYRQLRRRYVMLQRKCKSLTAQVQGNRSNVNAPPATFNAKTRTRQQSAQLSKFRFRCRICQAHFKSIYPLLRHKRTRKHWPRRTPTRFAATCCGCEKFFRHKIALRNHMRYICQALPLCWFKLQMQTFKCRCCRRSTFNHWRLYRRHEVKCKAARRHKNKTNIHHSRLGRRPKGQQRAVKERKVPLNVRAARTNISAEALPPFSRRKEPAASKREYACTVCAKVFASANSLSQHNITHTEQRRHKCSLCARAFKRRNGLTQHVRGFHLQLKPHKCHVCERSYALKSDMLRCRHAAVKRATSNGCAAKD